MSKLPIINKLSNALELEELARQQRAIDQGFTTDAYHGTIKNFDEFKIKNDLGVHVGNIEQANERLNFLRDGKKSPKQGENILPLKVKMENTLRLNDLGEWVPSEIEKDLIKNNITTRKEINQLYKNKLIKKNKDDDNRIDLLKELIKSKGYDSVVYKNTGEIPNIDENYLNMSEKKFKKWAIDNAKDSYIILNPENIRSRFAKFDPANEGKSGLLLSKTPMLTPVDYQPEFEDNKVDPFNVGMSEALPAPQARLRAKELFGGFGKAFMSGLQDSGRAGATSMMEALENQYVPEGAVGINDAGQWTDRQGNPLNVQRRPNIVPLTKTAEGGYEGAMPAMADVWNTMGGVGRAATLGAGPVLRPALKYKDKIYKAKEGQQHLDALPVELQDTFQKMAMSGEDISHFNFGFINHKGHFLQREDALEYAIEHGILDPNDAKYGTLVTTMLNDSGAGGKLTSQAVASNRKNLEKEIRDLIVSAKKRGVNVDIDPPDYPGGDIALNWIERKYSNPSGQKTNKGEGAKIIQELNDIADKNKTKVRLLAIADEEGQELVDYYKKLGFKAISKLGDHPDGIEMLRKPLLNDSGGGQKVASQAAAGAREWNVKGFEDADWFHGTTHELFNKFSKAKGNIENHLGEYPHFTSSPEDAGANYAGMGPDLTNRVEKRAEEIISGKNLDWNTSEYNKAFEEAKKKAIKELAGKHEGAIIPAKMKLDNPVSLVDNKPTWIDFTSKYDKNGEWVKENPNIIKLLNTLKKQGEKYGFDGQKVFDDISEKVGLYDKIKASDLDKALRKSEPFIYDAMKGDKLASSHIISEVFKALGFDGIVMDAHAAFPNMKNIPEGTLHAVPLKRNTVKGKYSDKILYSKINLSPIDYQPEFEEETK